MKKTDKNFSDHELYDDVIHGLKSPYIRLSDIKLRNERLESWQKRLDHNLRRVLGYFSIPNRS